MYKNYPLCITCPAFRHTISLQQASVLFLLILQLMHPAVASTKAEASTVGNTKAVTPKTDVSNVEATKVESPKFDAAKAATPMVVNTSIGTPQIFKKSVPTSSLMYLAISGLPTLSVL